MDEWIRGAMYVTTRALEIGGIAAILVGAAAATVTFLSDWRNSGDEAFNRYRSSLGRSILLGLEFLVAADIINTVAIEPTLENLAVLGAIVLIRTFLSFSLEVEIEGRWPWAKHEPSQGAVRVSPGRQS